jgi:hypothetical protein
LHFLILLYIQADGCILISVMDQGKVSAVNSGIILKNRQVPVISVHTHKYKPQWLKQGGKT